MNNKNIKSCIILCGGMSKRMGQDKGSMIIQNEPMIKHILSTLNYEIDEAILVLNNPKRIEKYRNFINENDYTYKIKFLSDEMKRGATLLFFICKLSPPFFLVEQQEHSERVLPSRSRQGKRKQAQGNQYAGEVPKQYSRYGPYRL